MAGNPDDPDEHGYFKQPRYKIAIEKRKYIIKTH